MTETIKRGFKRKTIVQTIDTKMEEWIATLPEDLRYSVRHDYIVTGGAIVSMLQGDLPNDYDIYFQSSDILDRVKAFYNNPNQHHRQFKPVMITDNAISLMNQVQIITRFVGDPALIHRNFDYIHTTNYYTKNGGLVLNPAAMEAVLARELRYQGSLYPLCAMFRMKKFLKRGWTITAGEMFKIGYDISKLNLDDIPTLKEQLVGIDALYFVWALKELEKLNGGEFDRTHLFEIMNRAFDEPDLDIPSGGGMT